MKPTKMRNKMIYRADFKLKSKQLASLLSKDLRERYNKRSTRVMTGDSIKVIRGEFKGVRGKVTAVSTAQNSIAVDGVQQEKIKGEKFDVYIHTSNIVITGLNEEDNLRISKLKGESPSSKDVVSVIPPADADEQTADIETVPDAPKLADSDAEVMIVPIEEETQDTQYIDSRIEEAAQDQSDTSSTDTYTEETQDQSDTSSTDTYTEETQDQSDTSSTDTYNEEEAQDTPKSESNDAGKDSKEDREGST